MQVGRVCPGVPAEGTSLHGNDTSWYLRGEAGHVVGFSLFRTVHFATLKSCNIKESRERKRRSPSERKASGGKYHTSPTRKRGSSVPSLARRAGMNFPAG